MTRARLICCLLIAVGLAGFAWRTVLRAYVDTRNDLSDPYFASRLWLRGQNPYDVALATKESTEQIHSAMRLVPVYPPTAYVVLAPVGQLPWRVANLVWALLGLAAIGSMAYLLPGIAGVSWHDDRSWLLAAGVFCAAPLHTGLHAANSAPIVIFLCLATLFLARADQDFWAGVLAALAVCLKPQLGVWLLVFYAARRRWSVLLSAVAMVAAVVGIAVLRMPLSPMAFLQNYAMNLHYWFDPGKMNDFSVANHFRFELVNAQVLLQPILRSPASANVIAWGIFGVGFGAWVWTVLRNPGIDELPALASLMMLSMIPVYHRSYDAAIVLLALASILQSFRRPSGFSCYAQLLLTFALLAPAPSAIFEAMSQGHPRLHVLASTSAFAVYSSLAIVLLSFVLLQQVRILAQIRNHALKTTSNAEQEQANAAGVLLAHQS